MLDKYIELIKSGGVVAFPTETVYGLGADAWNLSAVRKVFETKGRPADNPLIVHIASVEMLQQFTEKIPESANLLMDYFWPGPLTFIFKKRPEVMDAVTAGLETVAIRYPSHPTARELIAQTGPLVAPSANSSGRPSPTKLQHVKEDFGNDFPVIEGGETKIGLESTVLDVSSQALHIYRPGAISAKQIKGIVNEQVKFGGKSTDKQPARSPGTKYSHYSPNAEVVWWNNHEIFKSDTILFLIHTIKNDLLEAGVELPHDSGQKITNAVFFEGNYQQMAHQLFDRFRQADHQGYQQVCIEPFSDRQLQKIPIVPALQNRISKAVG